MTDASSGWTYEEAPLPKGCTLISFRRESERWQGFVRLGRRRFTFVVALVQTPAGEERLTVSFELVVRDVERLFRKDVRQLRKENHARFLSDGTSLRLDLRVSVYQFTKNRKVLPNRVYAFEGSPFDWEGSLDEAIRALALELRGRSARRLRKMRMDPNSPLRVLAAERAEYPDWDGKESIEAYRGRRLRADHGESLPDEIESDKA